MEDIIDLREKRSHLTLSAGDILKRSETENRYLTPEEQTESKRLLAEADGITDQINGIKQAQEEAERIRTAILDNGKQPDRRANPGQPATEPSATSDVKITPMPQYGSLKAYKGEKAADKAYEAGMWLLANFFPSDNPNHRRARDYCSQHLPGFSNALSTSIPAAGGNLVPDVMAQTIIDLREQYGIFRQWADVMPMSSDYQIIPRRSGSVTPAWTAEGVAISASAPTFDNVTLTAKKLAAYTLISSELVEDAIINIADWVTYDIGQQFAYEEDRVGFNGTQIPADGNINGLMNAILSSNVSASYIDVVTATHNMAAEIDSTDITTLMGKLPQYALPGAAFFCSQTFASNIFGRLAAAAGGNTIDTLQRWNISSLGQRGIVGSFLGYPIVASQVLPTGTCTSVPMLAFGNLAKAATLGERRQIRFAMDSSIKFAEDQIAIKATTRLDINVHDLGNTSTVGPIVVLKGGSS